MSVDIDVTQDKFYWISNKSGVAELIQTVAQNRSLRRKNDIDRVRVNTCTARRPYRYWSRTGQLVDWTIHN